MKMRIKMMIQTSLEALLEQNENIVCLLSTYFSEFFDISNNYVVFFVCFTL